MRILGGIVLVAFLLFLECFGLALFYAAFGEHQLWQTVGVLLIHVGIIGGYETVGGMFKR